MIEAGKIYNLEVKRRTDLGYMLKYDDEEIFLHQNQTRRELRPSEMVDVFIYYDNKRRISATMEEPLIVIGKPAFLKVVDIDKEMGAFLYMGVAKDVLLSRDFLPYDFNEWPQKDDLVYVEIKEKKNQLVAKIVGRYDVYKYRKETINLGKNEVVEAYIQRINPEGSVAYTKDLNVIFIHKTQMRDYVRVGERVEVTIMKDSLEGEYSGTLIGHKEDMISIDASNVLEYLKNTRNQEMPYGNDSSPEEILRVFKMSKKAFKRALGHLYKEHLIEFVLNKTVLKKEE